jgi:hypothetical protein
VRGESEPELETTNRKARAHDASIRANAPDTHRVMGYSKPDVMMVCNDEGEQD